MADAPAHRTRLDELAEMINPVVAGWMNYYGRFYRSELYPLIKRVNTYLTRWARRKYKRLRALKRFARWWRGITERARNYSCTGGGRVRSSGIR
jgi:hypothetical protein